MGLTPLKTNVGLRRFAAPGFNRRSFCGVGSCLLGVLVLAVLVGMTGVDTSGPSTISRISFSESDPLSGPDETVRIRFHSDAEIAWYSFKSSDDETGVQITLLNTSLSEDVVLETARVPIDSYTVDEENGKVIARFVYDAPGRVGAISQDSDSFDLIFSIAGYSLDRIAANRAIGADSDQANSNNIVTLLSSTGVQTSADSTIVDAGDSIPIEETEESDEPDAASRAELFMPKKLTTAGPALLPKAADVAAIESGTVTNDDDAGSKRVLSDIERLFSSSLDKTPASAKKPDPSPAASNEKALTNKVMSGPGSQWTLDTIVLDAGHGGWDEGAFGSGGALEKNVALKLVLKLGQMLQDRLGLNVVYTREDDRFITLAERGRIANQAGAKLFLSIHANSSKFSSARGTETFFLGVHRSDSAQVVMERENEVVKLEEDDSQYAKYTSTSLAQQALAQSSFLRRSEMLAEAVQTEFRDGAFRVDRGVKQAGFYVLFGASMPAVLIELGFLTNPYEEKFLSSSDGQTTMANAIFRAVEQYKIEYERTLQVAGQ